MKPLKLEMQAFGPFANSETVDFTKLGTNPLFLINGATGAGKSSILDAICYALYGQTTGAEREASQMRCDHSDMALLTEVSLEFNLGEKRYRIRRVPMQERSKSRGEGTTIQQPEAQLWELDGTEDGNLVVSRSVADATAAIKGIIGLDVDQFRQVMVLPQGKFRDLLMADSREREKIFGQLFQTGIYKRIEEQLKAQAAGIKNAVEHHQSEIKGILQSAEVSTEGEIADELEALQPRLTKALTEKDAAYQKQQKSISAKEQGLALNQRFIDLGVKEKELAQKTSLVPAIDQKQERLNKAIGAQKIHHYYEARSFEAVELKNTKQLLDDSAGKLTQVTKDHKQSKQDYALAKKAFGKVDSLKEQQADLKRYELQLTELATAISVEQSFEKSAFESKCQFDKKREERESLSSEQLNKEGQVTALGKLSSHGIAARQHY